MSNSVEKPLLYPVTVLTEYNRVLQEALLPFAQFGLHLKALEEIGDIGVLQDHQFVTSIQGGGGTWALLWSDFKKAMAALEPRP